MDPGDVDPAGLEHVHFLHEFDRVDHHAVRDHARHAGAEDAGRDQMEHEMLAVDLDCMAGVVAALETDHHPRRFRQDINDFSLAFIAPLDAYEHTD